MERSVLSEGSKRLIKYSDVMLCFFVIGILVVLIVPLPPALLDILITINISIAILNILITLSTQEPLELSTFPSLLLFMTLFRLSLNVASTRLILGEANAGKVIQAFGDFVVSGDYVVGMVIFLILIIIQFVVITKGSNRISEVAARFTLDAMPGKQMAIDADLNTGLISTEEAKERREAITKEADFYGAMDGASKFVRGDAVAGLIITAVNIVGGVIVGLMNGLEVQEALKKFALLTVGDGLVSQIPALIVATAAGIIVTKASTEEQLSTEMTVQLVTKPRAIGMASCVLFSFAIMPGLPALPFLCIAVVLGAMYFTTRSNHTLSNKEKDDNEAAKSEPTETHSLEKALQVDRMSIEIGYRLIYLVDPDKDGGLLEHISVIRRRFAGELGIIVPPIRVKDNVQLEPNGYRILIGGQEVGAGSLYPGHYLTMDAGGAEGEILGIDTTEPTFGLPAKWISESFRQEAEMMGYTVIDTVSVLVTHLSEVIRGNAHDLLSRDDVRTLVDNVKEQYPALVEDLIPSTLSYGELQRVLYNLLREKVSIRNLPLIMETLADQALISKDTLFLTEAVRGRLSRAIVEPHLTGNKTLHVISLDPGVEGLFEATQRGDAMASQMASPQYLQKIIDGIASKYQDALKSGHEPVLMVKASIRRTLADLVTASIPRLSVLSFNEILDVARVESVGIVQPPESKPPRAKGVAEPAGVQG
ncbi:MAG: flagellar biosynthesis protein FlhA [Planctomycetota bacterium]